MGTFSKLLGKAKDLVDDKAKLSDVIDKAADVIDTKTKGRFAAQLSRLDDMVDDLRPSDLDQLQGLADKLDTLDDDDIAKVKEVVGKLAESKSDDLSDEDLAKLKDVAKKLGIADPTS